MKFKNWSDTEIRTIKGPNGSQGGLTKKRIERLGVTYGRPRGLWVEKSKGCLTLIEYLAQPRGIKI